MKMRRRNLRSSKMFGVISRKGRVPNRKIDQEVGRSWECDCCYITLDKDTNTTINIKRIREAQLGSSAQKTCGQDIFRYERAVRLGQSAALLKHNLAA